MKLHKYDPIFLEHSNPKGEVKKKKRKPIDYFSFMDNKNVFWTLPTLIVRTRKCWNKICHFVFHRITPVKVWIQIKRVHPTG